MMGRRACLVNAVWAGEQWRQPVTLACSSEGGRLTKGASQADGRSARDLATDGGPREGRLRGKVKCLLKWMWSSDVSKEDLVRRMNHVVQEPGEHTCRCYTCFGVCETSDKRQLLSDGNPNSVLGIETLNCPTRKIRRFRWIQTIFQIQTYFTLSSKWNCKSFFSQRISEHSKVSNFWKKWMDNIKKRKKKKHSQSRGKLNNDRKYICCQTHTLVFEIDNVHNDTPWNYNRSQVKWYRWPRALVEYLERSDSIKWEVDELDNIS